MYIFKFYHEFEGQEVTLVANLGSRQKKVGDHFTRQWRVIYTLLTLGMFLFLLLIEVLLVGS